MAKVFVSGSDVEALREDASSALTRGDIDKFYNVLDDMSSALENMSKALKDMKEKVKPPPEEKEKTPDTWIGRWKDNQLREMFVGKEVTSEDIDSVVNTLTLVCALILTIPYGVMTSADHSYWDNVEDILSQCEVKKFTYDQAFKPFSGGFNSIVYSNISVLIMAVLYYLLRPKDDAKFRKWWKYARYILMMMMLGTVCSVVCLVIASSWLFSWYIIPNSKLCTFSAKTDVTAGIIVIGFCALTSFFCML